MKCFKVARNIQNEFISSSMIEKHSLVYRIGEKTVPLVGKIFVFEDIQSAKDFRKERISWANAFNADREYIILECKCGPMEVILSAESPYDLLRGDPYTVEDWWEEVWHKARWNGRYGYRKESSCRTPWGSFVTDWVIPMRIYGKEDQEKS